jgi:hypothetical protein
MDYFRFLYHLTFIQSLILPGFTGQRKELWKRPFTNIPSFPMSNTNSSQWNSLSPLYSNIQMSYFLALPDELLLLIVQCAEPNEFWALSVSCQDMWRICQGYVRQRQHDQLGRVQYPYSFLDNSDNDWNFVDYSTVPISSVIWDIYELLSQAPRSARCTNEISLKKESRPRGATPQAQRQIIDKLNELSSSSEIQRFVGNSTVLRRCNMVQDILTGLQIPIVDNELRHHH